MGSDSPQSPCCRCAHIPDYFGPPRLAHGIPSLLTHEARWTLLFAIRLPASRPFPSSPPLPPTQTQIWVFLF